MQDRYRTEVSDTACGLLRTVVVLMGFKNSICVCVFPAELKSCLSPESTPKVRFPDRSPFESENPTVFSEKCFEEDEDEVMAEGP